MKIAAKDPGTESISSISSSDGPQQWSSTDKSSCIQLSQSNLRALMKGYGSGSVRSNRLIPASGKVHKFNAFVTMTRTIQQFYLICCEKYNISLPLNLTTALNDNRRALTMRSKWWVDQHA